MKLRDVAMMTGRTEKTVRNRANTIGVPRQGKTRQLTHGDTLGLLMWHEFTERGIPGAMCAKLITETKRDVDALFFGDVAKSYIVIMPDQNRPGHYGFTCLQSADAAVHLADTHAGSALVPLHTVVRSALARMIEHKDVALAEAMETKGNA